MSTSERSTVEILRAARERITPGERWTGGAYARDADGQEVFPFSERACSWCAVGSVAAELGLDVGDAEVVAVAKLLGLTIEGVNDRRGHAAVLARFDRAIELAEAEAR